MQPRYRILWRLSALLVAGLLLVPASAFAQRTVTGTVTDAKAGTSIPGANVRVQGTSVGTTTNAEGTFRLDVPANRDVLVFSFIGYQEEEVELEPGQTTVDVALQPDVVGLDEVVVTGLASSVKRENLANSIESISAEELAGTTEITTLDQALSGKVTGAQISSYSGAPGGGMNVRLRGVSTINGNAQPLYIVDGIIVSNASIQTNVNAVTEAASGGNRSSQDNPVNRIADINPNNIASIEILKGPSAAAIYGGRASNGVVIIKTKQGQTGETRVDFSQKLGVTTIRNKLGSRTFTTARADSAFSGGGAEFNLAAQGRGFFDYEEELFGQEGLLSTTSLSVSGGNEDTRFYVSGTWQDDEGIIERTGYERRSARVNINHSLSSRMRLTGNVGYYNTETRRGLTGNDNSGTTFGVALTATPNFVDLKQNEDGTYPVHPFNASNPLQTRDLFTNEENVNRVIAGVNYEWDFLTTESQRLGVVAEGGVDFFEFENIGLFPRALQFEPLDQQPGTSILGQTNSLFTNYRLLLVHEYNAADLGLGLTTQAGFTASDSDQDFTNLVARNLIPGQQNINQAAALNPIQEREFENNRSFFVQEEANYNDVLIGTIGVRGDRSSLNGNVDRFYLFPKASLAFNMTNAGFWTTDAIDQLKLRVAFGQTGNTTNFGTKSTVFQSTSVGGQVGTTIDTERGDATIEPERQSEIETGFDVAAFNRRASLSFTVYRKEITDQLLRREVPASTGFRVETFNGGSLVNRGLEASLTLIPITRENVEWESRINFWTNEAEVTDLPVPSFRAIGGGFGATLGEIRIQEGRSPTQAVGVDDRLTQYFDTEQGQWITVANVPDGQSDQLAAGGSIVYQLGDVAPDFQMSFSNRVSLFNGLSFSVLAHWKKGGDNLNLSELLFDLNGTSPDYDERVQFTRNIRNPNGTPIVDELGGDQDFEVIGSCPQTTEGDPTDFATCTFEGPAGEVRSSFVGVSAAGFVQNASYFRIREVGLFYNLPQTLLQSLFQDNVRNIRVGLSANNILTITPYKSYDPEVNNFGAQPVAGGVEVTPYPQSRQFYFHLNVGL